MKAAEKNLIIVLSAIIVSLIALPSIGIAQDRDSVYLYYGNLNGSALDVSIDERISVDLYIFTPENAYRKLLLSQMYLVHRLTPRVGQASQYLDFAESLVWLPGCIMIRLKERQHLLLRQQTIQIMLALLLWLSDPE